LLHAYVEEMVRFYLSEEPAAAVGPHYDPFSPTCWRWCSRRIDELVIKPRTGHGVMAW